MDRFKGGQYFKNKVIRRYCAIAAFAVVGLVAVGIILMGRVREHAVETQPLVNHAELGATSTVLNVLPAAQPVRIRIPSIGVDAPFENPLGVTEEYEIEVPDAYDTVGWYKYGPTPGEIGPAVVLGHVDSYQGPAVLYSLGQVQVGETIEIEREDGTTAVFVVEALERHLQSGFPTEEVYSDLPYAGLRIITCSGTYNKGIQRYSHNLIVFARLQE